MNSTANARVAGLAYLTYMAAGASNEFLMGRATDATGAAATLARIAGHVTDVRVAILLTLVEAFCALVLAVTLYGITRDQDHELAMLALACRVAEGVIGSGGVPRRLELLRLAHAPIVTGAATNALEASVLAPAAPLGAIFFAVGSAIFAWLLLRGRMIPVPLAWLGVGSSALLVVGVPLELAGWATGPWTVYQWLPAMVFTFVLGLWLLIKGVRRRELH
jgi:hypothetical protein